MQPTQLESTIIDTWDFHDPAATEDAFHRLIAESSHTSPYAAVLLTQVARTHSLRHAFDEAHDALDTAAGIIETLGEGPERDHAEARIAIERGRTVNSAGSPADALPYFEAAHEFATRAGTDGLAVDALHMQAIAVGQTGTRADADALNQRALDLAEESSDPTARRWRATLLNNLGWDAHADGDFERAHTLLAGALEARLEQGDAAAIAIARYSVARALRSLGRLDDALAIQLELADDPANADDGYIPEEIGECLVELGRVEEAKAWFARAHALLSQDPWLVEHEPERLARLAEYADSEDAG